MLNLGIQTISTVSTRIEYEDGVVYFDPEPSEMEQMEYVCLLSDGYENGDCYPYRFFDRLCKGAISPKERVSVAKQPFEPVSSFMSGNCSDKFIEYKLVVIV